MPTFDIVISCLLASLLMHTATSDKFVTIECKKSDIVAHYGTNTLLDCSVQFSKEGDDPAITIVSWKRNGEPVLNYFDGTSTPRYQGIQLAKEAPWDRSNKNVSLLITGTNLNHTGKYTCHVYARAGRGDSKPVHLRVKSNYGKATIISDQEKIGPEKDFTVTCEAHGGYPKGDIRWVVNNNKWKRDPVVEVKEAPSGLLDLTSKLHIGHNSPYSKFVCEVYNADGVKEDDVTWENLLTEESRVLGDEPNKSSMTKIVAPVVVIGSLIVGLLMALLFLRRRQKARRLSRAPLMNVPVADPEENVQMTVDPQKENAL